MENKERTRFIPKVAAIAFIPMMVATGCKYTPDEKQTEKHIRQSYSELSTKYMQGDAAERNAFRP